MTRSAILLRCVWLHVTVTELSLNADSEFIIAFRGFREP
jgi:hypothetical protein